jgi:hypothetical protein
MRRFLLIAVGLVASFTNPVFANDHNNLDSGRPLYFDDAESMGFGEQSIEFGGSLVFPENSNLGGEFDIEYLNGIIRNGHIIIGIDPQVGGRVNSDDTSFDVGNLSVGFFYNFNREYDNVPAFAIRTDLGLPTGNNARGLDFRLRGIASKTVGQFDRLHLNLDLNIKTDPDDGDRSFLPAAILGYSRPIGYPKRFDQTFLAELGVITSDNSNGGVLIRTGMGIRQQINRQGVIDFGIEGDIGTNGNDQSQLKLKIGYSFGF